MTTLLTKSLAWQSIQDLLSVSTDSDKMALVANVLDPRCAELVFFPVCMGMSPPSFFFLLFLLFSQFYDDHSI
jgi:hypothetical protein